MATGKVINKPSLLIVYDQFYPGFKAGGPIQSLTNLVIALEQYYKISVLTSAYDLYAPDKYPNINLNFWNEVTVSASSKPINIWYAGKNNPQVKTIAKIIDELSPSFIYLNGIFNYRFFILPLIAIVRSGHKPKLIICPRGMLQSGALSGKSLKKKFYLKILELSGFLKKADWHATNKEEEEDIKQKFGKRQRVVIAANIPKAPVKTIRFPAKQNGLRLVYLSLIAEKKICCFYWK